MGKKHDLFVYLGVWLWLMWFELKRCIHEKANNQHRNGYNSVCFTCAELKIDVVVADSHSHHITFFKFNILLLIYSGCGSAPDWSDLWSKYAASIIIESIYTGFAQ